MKYIKNTTGSDKTWLGTVVSTLSYCLIEDAEEKQWASDTALLEDITSGDAVVAKADDGSGDITDINDAINYLKDISYNLEVDSEGRQISRIAAGKKGWVYMSHPIEISTSTVGGSYSTDHTNTPRTDFSMQLYDASNTLITDQATADTGCVKTVITFAPAYDYEIISGNIYQKIVPTSNVRLWVTGGAFHIATAAPVLIKEFVSGFNLAYLGIDDHIETDGRASKMMYKDMTTYGLPYPTYQGNGFQYTIRHDAGIKHDIMVTMEYFRG